MTLMTETGECFKRIFGYQIALNGIYNRNALTMIGNEEYNISNHIVFAELITKTFK